MNKEYYMNYAPTIGDGRYTKFTHKSLLDIIRVRYYKKYGKDPSISDGKIGGAIFHGPTLPIFGDSYYFRGKFPFKIWFSSSFKGNDTSVVSMVAKKEHLNEENAEFMLDIIKDITNQDANLIFNNLDGTEITVSFIDIGKCFFFNEDDPREYYRFFDLLCDNIYRDIIYIGDSLKDGVDEETLKRVDENYVKRHKRMMVEYGKVTQEELDARNEYVKTIFYK